jgi:hypothetical protein
MKPNVVLTVTSLLCILLLSIHVTDDIARGFDQWTPFSPIFCVVLGVLLYGALMLAERRSGLIMMLITGLAALGMPIIHSKAGAVAKSSGGFLFLWTLIALGATGTLSLILAIRGLLSPRR